MTLRNQAIGALKWNYFGNVTKFGLQFILGVVLARLLGPEAFGMVAIAWLIIGVSQIFVDSGFSAVLIQRPELSARDIGFVVTVQVFIGLLIAGSIFLVADQIGRFFEQPSIGAVIRWMCPIIVLQAFTQAMIAILSRSLRFKLLQVSNLASYLLGYGVVGLSIALWGGGVWSLVAAQLVQAISSILILYPFSRIPVRPSLVPDGSGLIGSGGKILGANLCRWSISNMDSLIIGKLIGVHGLGVYNRSMNLVLTPVGLITSSLSNVLLATCSRAQGNLDRVRLAYLGATELLGYFCFPVFLAVAAVPDAVVTGLYGSAWAEAIPVVRPLALAVAFHSLLFAVGPVLIAIGKAEFELRAQLATSLLMIASLLVAAQHSLVIAAWVVFACYLFRWMVLTASICMSLDVPIKSILRILRLPAFMAIVVAATLRLFTAIFAELEPTLSLILQIVLATVILLALCKMIGPSMMRGPAAKLARDALPRQVARWLRSPAGDSLHA